MTTHLSSMMRFVCTVATLMMALPAFGQGAAFDPVPVVPTAPDFPLVFQRVPPPDVDATSPIDAAQRIDRNEFRRSLDEVLERIREEIKALDLDKLKVKDFDKIEMKIDQSMKVADWEVIAEKIRQASKDFEVTVPQVAQNLAQKDERVKVQADDVRLKLNGGFKALASVRGFNAVLVLGDMQGGSSIAENVPDAARKALADMKEFLPYRNYRLLDSAWILGAKNGVMGRLRGADEQVYQLTIQPNPNVLNNSIPINVKLQDIPDATSTTTAESTSIAIMKLERLQEDRRAAMAKLASLRASGPAGSSVMREAEASVAKLETQIAASQVAIDRQSMALAADQRGDQRGFSAAIVNTSFDINVGETVVVGTSRLRGDKALILLLTAVPQTNLPASGQAPTDAPVRKRIF